MEKIAKDFGVKPAEVRKAFDIALARQPKTSDTELAARREHQRNIVRKSWNRFINKSDYFELANDDDRFRRCCDIFEYMIASTAWRV